MKKYILFLILAVTVGIAYWLISPLFITRTVNEQITDIKTADMASDQYEIVSSGIFSGLAGHSAEGAVRLLKAGTEYYIRMDENFRVTNGPDLFVYLGKNNQYDPNARLDALKGNIGSQNYVIPLSINVSDYDEVWVWCRAFGVAFGKAVLNKQ